MKQGAMKPNELRIGNYIQREDLASGEPRFEQVLELSNKVTTTGPVKVICDYDDIEPIPLTEQWLKDFGFLYKDGDQCYINNFFHIEDRNKDEFLSEKDKIILKDSFGVWKYDSSCFLSEIKHVHQLQNLYFALTGEELKLNQSL